MCFTSFTTSCSANASCPWFTIDFQIALGGFEASSGTKNLEGKIQVLFCSVSSDRSKKLSIHEQPDQKRAHSVSLSILLQYSCLMQPPPPLQMQRYCCLAGQSMNGYRHLDIKPKKRQSFNNQLVQYLLKWCLSICCLHH